MHAGCGDDRVKGLIGLGVPFRAEGRSYTYEFLTHCTQPKLFISGTEDQFGPRDAVEPMLTKAADPKRIVWIEGAEHFFQGTPSSPGPRPPALVSCSTCCDTLLGAGDLRADFRLNSGCACVGWREALLGRQWAGYPILHRTVADVGHLFEGDVTSPGNDHEAGPGEDALKLAC